MSLLERLDREAKYCDAQLSRKMAAGYYEQSLCDLRELLEDAAKCIRHDAVLKAGLVEQLAKKKR